MVKLIRFVISCVFLLSLTLTAANAHFEEILEYDLRTQWLPLLGDTSLENRFQAIQAFLTFPKLGLPIIREAIVNPELEFIHWRLAYLLGVLGTQDDIYFMLQTFIQTAPVFQKKVWIGSLERIFWRYRMHPDSDLLISRLSFVASEEKKLEENEESSEEDLAEDMVTGTLMYKIVNPASVPRLIHIQFDIWKAQVNNELPLLYHWIESRESIEIEFPLELIPATEASNIRIDFKVMELGTPLPQTSYKIEIPLTPLESLPTPISPIPSLENMPPL